MEKDYFTRLTAAARWQMQPGEAAEFLADYREILEENPRSEEALLRELGEPWRAVRLSADRRSYCRWLAAFFALSLCLLLPALYGLSGKIEWLMGTWLRRLSPEVLLPAVGTAGALLLFRRRERTPAPRLPRPLWVLLPLLPALSALVIWWVWKVLLTLPAPPNRVGLIAQGGYVLLSLLAAALGLWGLTAARVCDRRWRALYVMALATAALCCVTLLRLRGMDIGEGGFRAAWNDYLCRCALIAGIGLVGTGAALC